MHALGTSFSFIFSCSSKSFQKLSKCTIYRPCFLFFFAAVPNRLKCRHNLMHALDTLFSFFLCSSKSFQNPSEFTIYRPCFLFFSAVPNRLKCRHNACFRDVVFMFFSAVPNRFKYHKNACFRDIAPGSYTSCTSDLIICQLIFVVRSRTC